MQTVARLVFGAHSSAAPASPPPETDGLLTPAEAAHKDVLTEVEEAASSKVLGLADGRRASIGHTTDTHLNINSTHETTSSGAGLAAPRAEGGGPPAAGA